MPDNLTLLAKEIGFKHNQKKILDAFYYEFSNRRIYPIIGANGCGKTSLLKILAGMCIPKQGNVYIEHMPLYPDSIKLKPFIGFSPVENFFAPNLTLFENFTLIGLSRGLDKNALSKRISFALDACDLSTKQKVLTKQLSDGYIKRALVAQALIHPANILFFDEPCALLDTQARAKLWQLFHFLQQAGNLIIFSTHHVQEALDTFGAVWQLQPNGLQQTSHFDKIIIEKEYHALKAYTG